MLTLPGGGSWTVTATDENGAEVYRELRHLRQGSQWEIPLPEFDSYLMLRATCAAQGARLNGGDWILPQNKAR